MSREEFVRLITWAGVEFENFNLIKDPARMENWFDCIGDLSYEQASIAMKKHMMTSSFAPKIADIRKMAVDMLPNQIQSVDEAWNEALEAVRKFGIYRVEEGVNSLSEPTKSIMRNQFRDLCMCENISYFRSTFVTMYNTYSNRDKVDRLLPESLKNEAKALTDKLANILAIEGKKKEEDEE